MLSRIESRWRRFRRWLDSSRWLARLMGLADDKGSPTRPGLVIIQIDGLARAELDKAMARGELPFLRRLMHKEHYHLDTLYSGLPSSTPAFQAELFYGVKTAVPAFSYQRSDSGEVVRMYQPEAASNVEQRLREQAQPLLKGGSAYCDIFTGGAEEAHFCPAALGWGPALRSANPLVLLVLFLTNIYSFVRVGLLLLLELALAVFDLVKGTLAGFDFIQELKFIPMRVSICILLRELCVIGAKMDISRGLPILHVNFIGYDEQSHRRGPGSAFAHWTLKGIDDAIARIWRAAHRAHLRDYEVWIHSDHGQVATRAYDDKFTLSLTEAVAAELEAQGITSSSRQPQDKSSVQRARAGLLGGRGLKKLVMAPLEVLGEDEGQRFDLACLGPVGFIYPPVELSDQQATAIAKGLVEKGVPAVIVRHQQQLIAWTRQGSLRIPQQISELVGEDHPFKEQLQEDFPRLCRHKDAGCLTLLGWCQGHEPLTFADENGSHAGLTASETQAFVLLPEDSHMPDTGGRNLRAADLRQAALSLFDRGHAGRTVRRHKAARSTRRIRLMTYNVHGCRGMDGQVSIERIARVIARYKPDIVALQELDVRRQRSGGKDQAHLIAEYLDMAFHFHPTLHLEEEQYGSAILSPFPMELVKKDLLPGLADKPNLEPRGAIWATLSVEGSKLQIINTHLGLLPRERRAQIECLLGQQWLGHADCQGPLLFCGDLNAWPSSLIHRRLRETLYDAQLSLPGHRLLQTFPGRWPLACLDHILMDDSLSTLKVQVPRNHLTRVASDHLPLIADIALP
ncbi:endonuclease/exonuclease/phosphatase family protein [Bowmanella dokdonensis]|uniref:Endonuclease/exonuclease/phosphatase family protein n=1 Tax=Bowmanella dokdonensis TaxID=751969 RepID=A0A939DPT1_9ALTE|nr:endonuclease/exonuclease/phosphatase family protein [Bowmanella dokdonensis]MBN7826565.1 endonuclease/exonuclease/phosphatase family protein [Bowmanella dokdonensis]